VYAQAMKLDNNRTKYNSYKNQCVSMRPIVKFILTNVEEFAFLVIALYLIYSLWPEIFLVALIVSVVGFGIFVIVKWYILKDSLSEKHYKYDIVGEVGITVDALSPEGHIRVKGELWKARSIDNKEIPKGVEVRIEKRVGHKVFVTRFSSGEQNDTGE